jgi:hypothetical protein
MRNKLGRGKRSEINIIVKIPMPCPLLIEHLGSFSFASSFITSPSRIFKSLLHKIINKIRNHFAFLKEISK